MLTAAAAGCQHANPLYQFWLRPATSSTWQMVQAYSTSATYDWNSTGAAQGTVYFGVWVKDANSPSQYDAVQSTSVSVTWRPARRLLSNTTPARDSGLGLGRPNGPCSGKWA